MLTLRVRDSDQSLACLSILDQWNPVTFYEITEA